MPLLITVSVLFVLASVVLIHDLVDAADKTLIGLRKADRTELQGYSRWELARITGRLLREDKKRRYKVL